MVGSDYALTTYQGPGMFWVLGPRGDWMRGSLPGWNSHSHQLPLPLPPLQLQLLELELNGLVPLGSHSCFSDKPGTTAQGQRHGVMGALCPPSLDGGLWPKLCSKKH